MVSILFRLAGHRSFREPVSLLRRASFFFYIFNCIFNFSWFKLQIVNGRSVWRRFDEWKVDA